MLKRISIFVFVVLVFILTACQHDTTELDIYDHLEKSVDLEKTFEEQQNPINDMEQKEQKIYTKLIDQNIQDKGKIDKLAKKAIKTIDGRTEKIDLEEKSMEASKEEYIKIKDLLTKLDGKKIQKKGQEMYQMMMKRYDVYDKLNQSYRKSLKIDHELYDFLQTDDVKQDELTDKVKELNDSYQTVLANNKKFNTYTNQYNDLKKEFYKLADIQVKYNEDK